MISKKRGQVLSHPTPNPLQIPNSKGQLGHSQGSNPRKQLLISVQGGKGKIKKVVNVGEWFEPELNEGGGNSSTNPQTLKLAALHLFEEMCPLNDPLTTIGPWAPGSKEKIPLKKN